MANGEIDQSEIVVGYAARVGVGLALLVGFGDILTAVVGMDDNSIAIGGKGLA